MGHARRMQHNRRRQIWDMIKENYNEENDSRQHDELSNREGEVSPSERASVPEQPCWYWGASGHTSGD